MARAQTGYGLVVVVVVVVAVVVLVPTLAGLGRADMQRSIGVNGGGGTTTKRIERLRRHK